MPSEVREKVGKELKAAAKVCMLKTTKANHASNMFLKAPCYSIPDMGICHTCLGEYSWRERGREQEGRGWGLLSPRHGARGGRGTGMAGSVWGRVCTPTGQNVSRGQVPSSSPSSPSLPSAFPGIAGKT